MVSYGQASGRVEPLDIVQLARKGALYLMRPSLRVYMRKRSDLLEAARELFDLVRGGDIKIEVNRRYQLRYAAIAHRDLEARAIIGSNILIP